MKVYYLDQTYCPIYTNFKLISFENPFKNIMNVLQESPLHHSIHIMLQKLSKKEEIIQAMEWVTGFDKNKVEGLIEKKVTFETFFEFAQQNPDACLFKRIICRYR